MLVIALLLLMDILFLSRAKVEAMCGKDDNGKIHSLDECAEKGPNLVCAKLACV